MKLISLDEMVTITREMFDDYTEPLALSLMSGEVPSTTFVIHREGANENEWLSQIRFKNTLTISVFRCDVFLDDVMYLCRRCKMYLITEEVFRVAVLYSMLHPLYQTQYMNFTTNANTDYDSMMAGAGKATYEFITKHLQVGNQFERVILEILRYHSMLFTNEYKYAEPGMTVGERLSHLNDKYVYFMNHHYPLAFRAARRNKSWTHLIDTDGFIILEPNTKGDVHYVGKEEAAAGWEEHKRKGRPAKSKRAKRPN